MSDFVGLGILTVALGSAAIGAGRRALERRRARRELAARPVLASDTAEGEVVRVTGIVRAGERTLTAPLSGMTCVCVRSRVSASSTRFVRRALRPRESFAMVPFLVDRDGAGMVSIEGVHALLDLEPITFGKKVDDDERQRRRRFLLAQGFTLRHEGVALYEETIVEPGMRVTIAGLMMKDPAAPAPGSEELGFRDAAAPSLRLAGNAEHPLVIGAAVDRKQLT